MSQSVTSNSFEIILLFNSIKPKPERAGIYRFTLIIRREIIFVVLFIETIVGLSEPIFVFR